MDLSKIKVCIFDVNGVLIDSNSANAQALAQAFTDQPLLQQQIAGLYLRLTGIDRGSKIRAVQEQLIKRPFRENEFELLWKKVKEQTRLSMLKAPVLPGSKEVLAQHLVDEILLVLRFQIHPWLSYKRSWLLTASNLFWI